MESKFIFREGQYKLVHTTNSLKDNLLVNSSQIEPEIDSKLKKIELAINNAHMPLKKLRVAIKLLMAVLCLFMFIWICVWLSRISRNKSEQDIDDQFAMKDGKLIQANGQEVKNGYISCKTSITDDNSKLECKYISNQPDSKPGIPEGMEALNGNFAPPLNDPEDRNIEPKPAEGYKSENLTGQKEYQNEENRNDNLLRQSINTKKIDKPKERTPFYYVPAFEDQNNEEDEYLNDIFNNYGDFSSKLKHGKHKSSRRKNHRNNYKHNPAPRFQHDNLNLLSNLYNSYEPDDPFMYSNPHYSFFDNQRHLLEDNKNNYGAGSSMKNSLLQPDNAIRTTEDKEASSVPQPSAVSGLTAQTEKGVKNSGIATNKKYEEMPVEIDGKIYVATDRLYPARRSYFLPVSLILLLLILVLEVCYRIISMRIETYLNNSIAHLIDLENKPSSPIKIMMMSEYTFVEVKVLGIIDKNKDQELTSEDYMYRSHNNSKHYYDRKWNKLQKKSKKHKPKYDNYLSPSDDSLDISMGQENNTSKKINSEASFVLKPENKSNNN